ncbi:tyrosine-protein phosphatase [Hyphomicrobium sp. ghe19]|uniref:tyrosine-protein phosphatase n=1 Tax=Hyphomicrobium sp. ghe19 TaxID=2682968 RepID=UPI0013673BDD|nr:Tyrosine-protein phosphatase YwqE [Hyphomicrobium sp. ghe19]
MLDLHCHLLPGIDDGPNDLAISLEMARAFVADGVSIVACTPHILPGIYPNSGHEIRYRVELLQNALDAHEIPLRLVPGADIHMMPNFVAGLRSGKLIPLNDTRYVLVEPPHHVAPPRLEHFFLELIEANYVPVLTHPERLSWIKSGYAIIANLAEAGVWLQITAGSLTGDFGSRAKYWAERFLDEGLAKILATDAHDMLRRPPILSKGYEAAARRIGAAEAKRLVLTNPTAILFEGK